MQTPDSKLVAAMVTLAVGVLLAAILWAVGLGAIAWMGFMTAALAPVTPARHCHRVLRRRRRPA